MAINRIKTGGITDGTIQSGDLAPGNIANDRLANNTITINGTSIALGASGDIVAGTDWQAVTVADGSTTVNTVAGGGYLLDTNAGVIEAFLPTSPSRGDTVVIADYSGTFATNKCIVNTGGENIDSTVGTDFQLTTNNTIAEFIYIDSSKGWLVKLNQAAGTTPSSVLTNGLYNTDASYISATGGTVTESGDYKIHTFTGDGCFVVSSLGSGIPCAEASTVDYLVVAGGGAGATPSGNSGGGGGAGGLRFYASPDITCYPASPRNGPAAITVSTSTYPITVGGGSAGKPYPAPNPGTERGSDSVFSTITSTGGGDGGHTGTGAGNPGNSGGSGGGASGGAYNKTAGAGNTPPTSPAQGSPGGARPGTCGDGGAGAGGGFLAAGENAATGSPVRTGGIGGGFPTSFVGTSGQNCGSYYYFSGGGGGGSNFGTAGGGALGGGGDAGDNVPGGEPVPNPGNGSPGTANTGGGGGGPNNTTQGLGGNGGKGIVIIRYKYQ